jgi:hypothetical protein
MKPNFLTFFSLGKSWADYSSESESDEGPITNEKVEPKYQEPDKYHQNVHHHHYHRQNYGGKNPKKPIFQYYLKKDVKNTVF